MERKALLEKMPRDKNDVKAAYIIVALGYPLVDPIMKDMLLWLRVYKSPVADVFAAFFADVTPQPVELIGKHIGAKSEALRRRILVDILPLWPYEAIQPLRNNLTMLATHPDALNNDIECFRLILKHKLAEKDWVVQWISFRKNQAVERVELFRQLESYAIKQS